MRTRGSIDVAHPAARRRWFLDRARRMNTRGAGSDLEYLLRLPRERVNALGMFVGVVGDVDTMLVGARAVNAYAPERQTRGVDVLVRHDDFEAVGPRLRAGGWQQLRRLVFPHGAIGLYGCAWEAPGGIAIDVLATAQPWGREAFASPAVRSEHGERVCPLPYLVLMKLDSARAVDHGDLSRMLGRLAADEVDAIAAVVARNHPDPQAAEDVRQYAEIGRWEYEADQAADR